ncbi:50S ribosomal protein L11 methyltransferase [Flexithrix dorotheae]|uniref:50S ribosomal protein L11 methyltransferase n=1 Tax=Flexithrix dorotheae TaxID=70993 RepID=UPI00035D351F|nr:50S ribosomal protein L11 methyltransferase [Flexithrix dorotheae]
MKPKFVLLKVKSPEELADIIKVELSEKGFDSFLDIDGGFEASIEKENFKEDEVDEIFGFYSAQGSLSYHLEEVEKQNWNELWEKNYDMVEISEDCLIRAAFHQPEKSYKYEIVITPKMSFGTGHHSTTKLMLLNQMEIDHNGKVVFDAGSGTGILAVMAKKLGAKTVDACDIEDWAVENANENQELNDVSLNFYLGKVEERPDKDKQYDIVLANINLNVILGEMAIYASMLKEKGTLILSGFYAEDIPAVLNQAQENSLSLTKTKVENNWTSLVFEKE